MSQSLVCICLCEGRHWEEEEEEEEEEEREQVCRSCLHRFYSVLDRWSMSFLQQRCSQYTMQQMASTYGSSNMQITTELIQKVILPLTSHALDAAAYKSGV